MPAPDAAGPSRLSTSASASPSILHLTTRLSPPSILGSTSWAHHLNLEDPTGRRMDSVQRWIRVKAPRLLQELREVIEAAASGELNQEAIEQAIVTATRFAADETWSCAKSRRIAKAILSHPSLSPSIPLVRSLLLQHLRPLFSVSSSSTNRSKPTLDPQTSRLVPPRTGLSSAYDHPDMADEVAWKGGSMGPRIQVAEDDGETIFDGTGAETEIKAMLGLRSPALGAPDLVKWCCGAAARLALEARVESSDAPSKRQEQEQGSNPLVLNGLPALPVPRPQPMAASVSENDKKATRLQVWDSLLPPLIPPLLALLQDPDPKYRTTGALALSALFPSSSSSFDPSISSSNNRTETTSQRRARRNLSPASTLSRMRLTPLILQNLLSSFAFLTHERGARLLDASLHAARELILCDTEVGVTGFDGEEEEEEEERRRRERRHDGITMVLEDGVFHAWTFGTGLKVGSDSKVDAEDEGDEDGSFDSDEKETPTTSGRSDDVLIISLAHLPPLLRDLGHPSIRYLGLTLEFLAGNLERLTLEGEGAGLGGGDGDGSGSGETKEEDKKQGSREVRRAIALSETLAEVVVFWASIGDEAGLGEEMGEEGRQGQRRGDEEDEKQTGRHAASNRMQDASSPPGLSKWNARCVKGIAKCWIRAKEVGEREGQGREEIEALQKALRGALKAHARSDQGARKIARELTQEEPDMFDGLLV